MTPFYAIALILILVSLIFIIIIGCVLLEEVEDLKETYNYNINVTRKKIKKLNKILKERMGE